MSDAPLQRMLKVGTTTIGLIGLDTALSTVLADNEMRHDDAVQFVFQEVAKKNYIPPNMGKAYREAIDHEIKRLRGDEAEDTGDLIIRILGPGCVSCNNLQKIVIEIMAKIGVAADVFQIHDLDEIGRYGILQTPALLINGEVKSSGRLPTSSQVEEWLREAINHKVSKSKP